jgi:hypothetical protein
MFAGGFAPAVCAWCWLQKAALVPLLGLVTISVLLSMARLAASDSSLERLGPTYHSHQDSGPQFIWDQMELTSNA